MILRKPVVFIQYANAVYYLPYASEYGAALDAKSPEELRSAIVSVLTNQAERTRLAENSRKALDIELLGPDGRSAERTIVLIEELILRRKRKTTPSP